MKKIAIIFISLLIGNISYSAPFVCESGFIFSDKNQCGSFCSEESGGKLSCTELDPSNISAGNCDTSKYQGFVYYNNKTYAITKQSVRWGSVKTAVINDETLNRMIAGILKRYGVAKAWIGAYDPDKSDEYEVVKPSRFQWRNGTEISYSNWKSGEPDNHFDTAMLGKSSVYGEHWAAIDNSGYWEDLGYNADGTERLLPAVAEFEGQLSCVSGKEKQDVTGVTGYVCAGEENSEGILSLNACTSGTIFDSAQTGYLCGKGKKACNKTEVNDGKEEERFYYIKSEAGSYATIKREWIVPDNVSNITIKIMGRKGDEIPEIGPINQETWEPFYLCEAGKGGKSSIIEYDVPVSSGEKVDISMRVFSGGNYVGDYIYVFTDSSGIHYIPAGDGVGSWTAGDTLACSASDGRDSYVDNYFNPAGNYRVVGYNETDETYVQITYDKKKTVYTCPNSGRPCIKDGSGYSCSPNDCYDGSDPSNFINEDTQEGINDANNNGSRDTDGSCAGIIRIFPGNDNRCRRVGVQTYFQQCCRIANIDETQKKDVNLSFLANLGFNVCSGSERNLWVRRGMNQCVYVGDYCSKKFKIGGCVQKKETYCCFNDSFSKAYNIAGKDLLKKGWGTAKYPDCGGFTPDEMKQLVGMGISEHPAMRAWADEFGEYYAEKAQEEINKTFNSDELKNKIKGQVQELVK